MTDERSAEDSKPDPQVAPDKPGDRPGPGRDQDESDQMPSSTQDKAPGNG